jgi:hypothetical protein
MVLLMENSLEAVRGERAKEARERGKIVQLSAILPLPDKLDPRSGSDGLR